MRAATCFAEPLFPELISIEPAMCKGQQVVNLGTDRGTLGDDQAGAVTPPFNQHWSELAPPLK